ncbi:MAG TPA: class I SAM-dependent methyltransferase [Crinalium sp.]
MKKSIKSALRTAFLLFESVSNARFYNLRKQTNGLLLPIAYKKIYKLCRQLPDLDVVEIGGATGAGSISIAWAMKESGKQSKLIVIEKCQGGTRIDVGGYSENLELIQNHFKTFNVQDQIHLFPHELTLTNGKQAIDLIHTPEIAAFIHDADGRIDRDFYLFYPLLKPGGLIIVDDYANEAKYQAVSDRHPMGGAKSIITYRLLNQIMEWGLFKPIHKIGKTIFGIKPLDADFKQFSLETCQAIIHGVEQERLDFLNSHEPKWNLQRFV